MRYPSLAALVLLTLAAPALHGQEPPISTAGPTIRILGFGDVVYMETERDVPSGFILGQMVGHLNAGLTERLTLFSELSATGQTTGFNLEVERLFIRYDFSDRVQLSLGRYHTPINYWNVAYHHGSWLQTTVSRPEMIRFGSRLLPVHFIGVLAEGSFPRLLGMGYAVGLGNGRHENVSRAGDSGDVNDNRAWLAELHFRPTTPTALYGLEVGGSVYGDRVSPEDGVAADEMIYSAHVVWSWERPEFMAEYTRLEHEPIAGAGGSVSSDAYYAQVAYRLGGGARDFKPYLRAERIDVSDTDPFLATLVPDYEALIGGLRYDFAPYAALKAEFRSEEFGTAERESSVLVQASFVVPGTTVGGDGM